MKYRGLVSKYMQTPLPLFYLAIFSLSSNSTSHRIHFQSSNAIVLHTRRDQRAAWKTQRNENSPRMELQQRLWPTRSLHITTLHQCGIPSDIQWIRDGRCTRSKKLWCLPGNPRRLLCTLTAKQLNLIMNPGNVKECTSLYTPMEYSLGLNPKFTPRQKSKSPSKFVNPRFL